MADLFGADDNGTASHQAAAIDDPSAPLAERLRPRKIEDVVGQDHIIGAGFPIGRMIAAKRLSSLILWGPPGTGKTTIARLLAERVGLVFEPISAVFSGVADLKKVFDRARQHKKIGRTTLLFVDEIHRFNRAQQDSFLPYVEDGTVVLVGATTENPSFELNAALLSRAQVLVLRRLDDAGLDILFGRAQALLGINLNLTDEARLALKAMADGDGRHFLNLVEHLLLGADDQLIDTTRLTQIVHKRAPIYDKSGEEHYNLISALHKSMRGSDVDAALYWLARMLAGGEAPLFILRRVVRFAVEDIGLADPNALVQALAAKDAYDFIGSPEGELAIAQAVIYLATAPKSNAAYRALKAAQALAANTGSLSPPKHILNAPTGLMKDLGYGRGYQYDHDQADGFSGQSYFPEDMERAQIYAPVAKGFEVEIAKRLAHWAKLRIERQG
jgi:putative ATPase